MADWDDIIKGLGGDGSSREVSRNIRNKEKSVKSATKLFEGVPDLFEARRGAKIAEKFDGGRYEIEKVQTGAAVFVEGVNTLKALPGIFSNTLGIDRNDSNSRNRGSHSNDDDRDEESSKGSSKKKKSRYDDNDVSPRGSSSSKRGSDDINWNAITNTLQDQLTAAMYNNPDAVYAGNKFLQYVQEDMKADGINMPKSVARKLELTYERTLEAKTIDIFNKSDPRIPARVYNDLSEEQIDAVHAAIAKQVANPNDDRVKLEVNQVIAMLEEKAYGEHVTFNALGETIDPSRLGKDPELEDGLDGVDIKSARRDKGDHGHGHRHDKKTHKQAFDDALFEYLANEENPNLANEAGSRDDLRAFAIKSGQSMEQAEKGIISYAGEVEKGAELSPGQIDAGIDREFAKRDAQDR